MNLRNSWRVRPIMAVLAATLAVVALACAGGDDPTATSAPTATSPAPEATSPAPTATASSGPTATAPAGATATSVPVATATAASLTWMERYFQSPGYKPEWGQPITGGIFKFGASHDGYRFVPGTGHGYRGDEVMTTQNALFRTDSWVGLGTLEGDLVESWEMSGDGLTLTMKLRQGVKFQDNSNVPAEYNGGRIGGDEYTCEDAKASFEFQMAPLEVDTHYTRYPVYFTNVKGYMGKAAHVEAGDSSIDGITCPDGPLGYTFQIEFDFALAKTMNMLAAGRAMANTADKDWIDWYTTENPGNMYYGGGPDNYLWLTGTGAMVAVEYQPDVVAKVRRNPTYFREGLPLLDGIDFLVLKDFTTRFTALVTGQVHFFGEGSSSLLPGQVEQVERDFSDRVTIEPIMHSWGRAGYFNTVMPIFKDPRTRQAVHIVLDRDEWTIFRQSGSFEGTQLSYLMPPGSFWAIPQEELLTWPGYRQPKDEDIAEANRLMDAVYGVGERPTARCMASNVQNNIDGCLFVMDQLKRSLGMEVTLDSVESAVSTQRQETLNYDMTIGSSLYTEVRDPDDVYPTRFDREFVTANTGLRVDGYEDNSAEVYGRVLSLTRGQSVELDPLKRRDMVWELERTLSSELNAYLILGWTNIFPGWGTNVMGYTSSNHYSQLKWAMWERVWLAD